ncbi:glycosyltransferase family 4 protein [Flavobacterium sp.]|uniref:glycosyltransferase family 4 protein n=1 Tax=Flavobacterium sp. TaxID=239 RepID=UPI00375089F8
MKICFVTLEYPHPKTGTSGGIGTSILNLSRGLVQLGHQVSIIIYTQDSDEQFHENGIDFYRLKNVKVKGFSLFFSQKKVEKLINSLYQQKKIDLVEVPDWTGFSALIKTKCPLIIRLNGSDTYFCHLDNRPVKPLNKFLEKRAFKKADGIISVSEFTGNLTNKLFNQNRVFKVIPNSIDISEFERLETPQEVQTIFYFGTLIRKKGLLELPAIFNEVYKHNKNVKLVLVGNNALDILENWTPTWDLMQPLFDKEAFKNVIYHGSVPYNEIKKHINQATICVFPTFAEALPVSWIEAMALQKPIVASNIGWAKEVIDDGIDGFLVHPKDHLIYAKRIIQLLNDSKLQKEFGFNARNKVASKFSIKVVAEQSVVFYKNFLPK